MTQYVSFKGNKGRDQEVNFSITKRLDGSLQLLGKCGNHDIKVNKLFSRLMPNQMIEAMYVLKRTHLILKNKMIYPDVNNKTEKLVKAAWISAFVVDYEELSEIRKEIKGYIDARGIQDLMDIIQYAYCNDKEVRKTAIDKLKSFPYATAVQKADVYDLCVDLQIDSVIDVDKSDEEEDTNKKLFWNKYCIQAKKRIPSENFPRPESPNDPLAQVVAKVGGFINAKIFKFVDGVVFETVKKALVCDSDGAAEWYEELRLKRVWGQETNEFQEILITKFSQQLQAKDYQIRLKCASKIQSSWKKLIKQMRDYIPGRVVDSQDYKGKRENLIAVVRSFLSGNPRVMLIQGDSGSGKTSACYKIAHVFVEEEHPFIPVYVPLGHLCDKSLGAYIDDELGDKFKEEGKFLFLFDGYDELKNKERLIAQVQGWENSKFIFTCRTQHLKSGYEDKFTLKDPLNQPIPDTFCEYFITLFDEEERKQYIKRVGHRRDHSLNVELFEKELEAKPRLKELASRPFVLKILTEVLPKLGDTAHLAQIYEVFVRTRFKDEKRRQDLDGGEEELFYDFSAELAYQMFFKRQQLIELPHRTRFRQRKGSKPSEAARLLTDKDPEVQLARSGCMLRGLGDNKYKFLHASLKDYFVAVRLLDFIDDKNKKSFGIHYLSESPEIVDFIAEMLWVRIPDERNDLIANLFAFITESKKINMKQDDDNDSNFVIKASSNAATVLARAGVAFSGRDLSEVRLDYANLNGGIFHHTNLSGSTLNRASMLCVQLVQTNLNNSKLKDAEFGEFINLFVSEEVTNLAAHPNEAKCALGTCFGKIEIWDIDNGEKICDVQTNNQKQKFVYDNFYSRNQYSNNQFSFSSCGKYLAISTYNTTEVYHLESGMCEKLDIDFTSDLAIFHPTKKILFISGSVGRLYQLCLNSKEKISDQRWISDTVSSACYSYDGSNLIVNYQNGDIAIGNPSEESYKSISIPDRANLEITNHPCENRFLVAGSDESGIIWEYSCIDLSKIRTLKAHTPFISSFCYSPDGLRVVAGAGFNEIVQWANNSDQPKRFLGHTDRVYDVCYSNDGQRILSGSRDKTVRQWDSSKGGRKQLTMERRGSIKDASFSRNGLLIISREDHATSIWSVSSFQLTDKIYHLFEDREIALFSQDGKSIIFGSSYRTLINLNIKSKSELRMDNDSSKITSITLHPHENRLLVGSEIIIKCHEESAFDYDLFENEPTMDSIDQCDQNNVTEWDLDENKLLRSYKGYLNHVNAVCYSYKGEFVFAGCQAGQLIQWDTKQGNKLYDKRITSNNILNLCCLKDTSKLVVASESWIIDVWNYETKDTHQFVGHTDSVLSISSSPEGKLFVSGSKDHTARVWDVTKNQFLAVLFGHVGSVNTVDWSIKGEILTGSDDQTIALWHKTESEYKWFMVWRSGYTPINAVGCKINQHTDISPGNHKLLIHRMKMFGEDSTY